MQTKRMFAHDYTRVGFYMITLVTAGRRPLFGECRENQVLLSAAGGIVKRAWFEIPTHNAVIEASTLVVMPDHLHGILYVKEPLQNPLGRTIRGFKSGVTAELRKSLHAPAMTVWEDGYHDRVIMSSETLRAERRYIHDNPRRHCLRKAHPDLFVRVNHLISARLPKGLDWTGFGNLFLLEKPELVPVQVSRQATPKELSVIKAEVAEKTAVGAVMVSPFISPGEKELAGLMMAQEPGRLILLKPDGFPPLYKPSGVYFDWCAQGRLLVLSPFVYTGHREALSRERCLRMNGWVREICREPEESGGKNAAAQ